MYEGETQVLVKPPIEKLLPKVENRYTLALAVAKRARQLVDGAEPLVDEEEVDSPSNVSLAAEELAADKIVALPGDHEPVIPLRPEILQAQQRAREDEDEDGLESLLRKDLEASEPAAEKEEVEEEQPRSLIRELREDEFFELPTDLEREFRENFGDLDSPTVDPSESYEDDSEIDSPDEVETEVALAEEERDDSDVENVIEVEDGEPNKRQSKVAATIELDEDLDDLDEDVDLVLNDDDDDLDAAVADEDLADEDLDSIDSSIDNIPDEDEDDLDEELI